MQDNTVTLDESESPAAIRFSPVFNVAVPFIDRHLKESRADKIAIKTVDENVTYGELSERVNRAGNALLSIGVKPAERVLMVVKDCPEFIYAFFGSIKAGIVPVPVNTMMRVADYKYLIENSECTTLVFSPEFSNTIIEALDLVDQSPNYTLTTNELSAQMTDASDDLEAAATTEDTVCFWLYSSGSTGNPKGVVHPHRSMVYTSQCAGVDTIGICEDDICFSVSKMFHSYGFGNALTFPLWVGATIALSDQKVTPAMTFEAIEKFRPTLFFGVPTLYAQQLHAMDKEMTDTSSIRQCISAGEALPGDVLMRWQEKTGTLIVDGLGSTEALHIFVSNTAANYKPGTSGRVVGRYEVRIVYEEGNEVEQGEIGTLHVRGGSTAMEYWKYPEKTAATMLPEGWLNTGDMYFQDEEGYYVNSGRGDDMLKVGGLWCSPTEIEACLIEHEKVLEVAVVGRADPDGLTKPEAHIILNNHDDAGPETEEELLTHCKAGIAHYKYPHWFNFIEELPKTATGKIQRFRLREQAN
ncbi:MAG: benzoate-CoA ligase family protein [Rhodospirillales bacterium]|nr:benzoate-CoA ligase family protein [Rhodospirillales bacterium]